MRTLLSLHCHRAPAPSPCSLLLHPRCPHPRCPRRGGIIWRNHGNSTAPLEVGAAGWVEDTGAHGMQRPHPQCTGTCTVASLSDSSFLVQQGCGCRGLLRCSMCSQGIHSPGSHTSTTLGVPQEPHVPCLFCSAGMEPPQAPRPPQPTHPLTAAAGPGRTLDYSSLPTSPPDATGMGFPTPLSPTLWRGGQSLPRSSSHILKHSRANAGPPLWGQTCPPSSAGKHWDPHLLSHGILLFPAHHMDRHPKPAGVNLSSGICNPQLGAGNEEEPKPLPYLCAVNASC